MKNFIFKLAPLSILASLAFLSYHQLLEMYFWRDDYTGIYFAQVRNLTQEFGFAFPYQMAFLIERFFFNLYGLEASLYYLTEVILYIFATLLIFYFSNDFFKNRVIAFCGSLIFAAGYIGQDAMKMSMGDGLGTIVALNVLLLNLVIFLRYLQKKKIVLLITAFILFFMTLETAPQRTSSSLLIFLLLDWCMSLKNDKTLILRRNLTFILIFIIQYFIHPSVWLLGYRVPEPTHFWGVLSTLSPYYLLNPLGTFWNMIFPSHLQDQFNLFINLRNEQLTLLKIWVSGIPVFIFAALSLVFIKFIRPAEFKFKSVLKVVSFLVVFSIIFAGLVFRIDIDRYDAASIFNGGVFLIFLITLIIKGVPESRILSLSGLLMVFFMLAIFFITIPERVLVSYNRYLLLPSFTIAFLPAFFITKEFYLKNSIKRSFARLFFALFIAALVLPRLFASFSTQQEFVQSYSRHAKTFYRELREIIPADKKVVIYVEGATKELDLSIGDAARVGYLGSEAAVAINLNTRKENILLPQSLEEIPVLLNKNKTIGVDDIYTFLYTEQGLFETSKITRELLLGNSPQVTVLPDDLDKLKIWSLQPIEAVIPLKAPNGVSELEAFWAYNTYGSVHKDRSVKIPLFTDGLWHEYKFIIPAGGEYLKRIYFKDLGFKPEIGKIRFKYSNENN